jgi:hypothetical protein
MKSKIKIKVKSVGVIKKGMPIKKSSGKISVTEASKTISQKYKK